MKALNPYREQLLGAFAKSVSEEGTTMIVFTHPNAPTLLLSRNPKTLPQVVPVLLAGSLFGGEEAKWKKIVSEVDLDGSGEIDFSEFKIMMKGLEEGELNKY